MAGIVMTGGMEGCLAERRGHHAIDLSFERKLCRQPHGLIRGLTGTRVNDSWRNLKHFVGARAAADNWLRQDTRDTLRLNLSFVK
jgi:hypothetical protein